MKSQDQASEAVGQQPRVTPRTLIGLLQDNRGDECESTNMVEGGTDGEAEDVICVVLALDIHACKDSKSRVSALAPYPMKGAPEGALSAVSNEKLRIAAGWFEIGDMSLDQVGLR